MSGRVIQGYFIGGTMRPQPALRAAAAEARPRHPTGAPPPAFAGRTAPLQARMAPGRPSLAHPGAVGAVQRHGADGSFEIDPVQLGLARGGGKPLPQAVLAKMEAAFGADFSAVRVHVGPQASRIGAIAFTTGNDLYFAPGRYQPDSVQGQQLIGHELAHVIQQRGGRVRAPGSGIAVVQDRALEAEADRLGMRAAAGGGVMQPKMRSPRPAPPPVRADGAPRTVQRMWIYRGASRIGNAVAGLFRAPVTRYSPPVEINSLRHENWETNRAKITDIPMSPGNPGSYSASRHEITLSTALNPQSRSIVLEHEINHVQTERVLSQIKNSSDEEQLYDTMMDELTANTKHVLVAINEQTVDLHHGLAAAVKIYTEDRRQFVYTLTAVYGKSMRKYHIDMPTKKYEKILADCAKDYIRIMGW